MSVELRRFILDPDLDPAVHRLGIITNRLIDMANGSSGGRVWLLNDDGDRKELLGGDVIDSNNWPLISRSGIGNHALFQHSNGVTTVGAFQDAGATIPIIAGNTHFLNNVDVDGTFNADGAATLQSTLAVTGASTLTGNVSAGGTLTVTGATLLNGAVTLGDAAADVVTVKGTATFDQLITATLGLTATTGDITATAGALAQGAVPATVGAIRLTNATGISFRNAANGANVNLVRSDASNNVLVGALSGAAQAFLLGTTGITLQVAGNNELAATTSGVTLGRASGNVGFFGSGGAAQPATTAAATDLPTVIALANALRTGVRAVNLFS